MTDYTLLTHVMDARHLAILDDWLAFAAEKPTSLNAVLRDDPKLRETVETFCRDRALDLQISATVPLSKVRQEETAALTQQFRETSGGFALVVRLDTFPFRSGHDGWLSEVPDVLDQTGSLFLTGGSMRYHTDTPTDLPHLMQTTRLSNNFLFIRPDTWLAVQQEMSVEAHRFGRYATEGLIELYCARTGARGLRRLNTQDWRVFHTQVWDERADAVRAAFRKGGKAIEPFLSGYEDNARHPWERYFMYPRPSPMRRIRIALGELRRDLTKSKT